MCGVWCVVWVSVCTSAVHVFKVAWTAKQSTRLWTVGAGAEGAMRTLNSKVKISRSARETWHLRSNFELEQWIALLGKRTLEMLEEQTNNVEGEAETQRVVRCELVDDHLAGFTFGAITAKDITSEVSSRFFPTRFEEARGSDFVVRMTRLPDKIEISGRQWCVPIDDDNCFMCTTVTIVVHVLAIGSFIEREIEKQMHNCYNAFPQQIDQFLFEVGAERATLALTGPGLAITPNTNATNTNANANATTTATTTAAAASLGEMGKFGSVQIDTPARPLFSTLMGRSSRHCRIRPEGVQPVAVASHTVIVRVGIRHALLLLCCGCAETVEVEDHV